MLQSILTDALWPVPFLCNPVTNTTIDSASDFVGHVFIAPETGTVTNLHFRVAAIATAQPIQGGIYTVDASTGGPGTLIGTAGTVTISTANTNYSLTGMSASVTKGEKYCIKLDFSGTAGNLSITSGVLYSQFSSISVFPYQVASTDNAGTLIKRSTGAMTPVSIEYSGGVFHQTTGVSPVGNSGTLLLASNGNIAGGIRFQVPVPMTVSGLWAGSTFTNGSGFELCLYDDAMIPGDPPLAKASGNENILSSNSNGTGLFHFDSGTEVTLVPGVWYRAVIRSLTTTNISFYRLISLVSTEHLKQMYGTSDIQSTVYTADAWTEADTAISAVGLIVRKFHDATGVGVARISLGI